MKVIEIIPSKRWKNIYTGQTASIYGAVPYQSEAEKAEWQIETVGYTWKLDNGQIGLGRKPAKTYDEAVKVMEKVNSL